MRGQGGYRQYRIPALAVTNRGTLLAAYDGRPNLDDLPNTIDLLLRRSTDCGDTWAAQQVVRTGTGLSGYGDPSFVVDHETGRIFLFHAAGTHAGFFESATGVHPEDDVQHADLSWSDDDGLTWHHRRITDQLKLDSHGKDRRIGGLFAAAGNGIQVHTGPYRGRLIQQFVLLVDGIIGAASALSDDHGDTWRLGDIILPRPGEPRPNENKTVCLSDGRLLLHSRATPRRLAAHSRNGGQSWSPLTAVEDLPDPSDNGSLARFDALPHIAGLRSPKTDGWLIATHNHDTHLRKRTLLRLSHDNGRTWPHAVEICPGSSAYSTALRLPNGNIGVLYERQGYREIVFASVPAGHLVNSGPPSLADEATPLAFDFVLRSVTPGRPATWQHVGAHHVIPPSSDEFDVQTWKEIGQGYSGADGQVLGTREAQDLNYGEIIPGYKAGDILAFTGRITNTSTDVLREVSLRGRHDNAADFPDRDLAPGEQACYFAPIYTITEGDIARGKMALQFSASGIAGEERVSRSHTFHVDLLTGEISTTVRR